MLSVLFHLTRLRGKWLLDLLQMESLAYSLAKFHDVFDFIPYFLHDPFIGFMLFIDLINGASIAHVFIWLNYVIGNIALAAFA